MAFSIVVSNLFDQNMGAPFVLNDAFWQILTADFTEAWRLNSGRSVGRRAFAICQGCLVVAPEREVDWDLLWSLEVFDDKNGTSKWWFTGTRSFEIGGSLCIYGSFWVLSEV